MSHLNSCLILAVALLAACADPSTVTQAPIDLPPGLAPSSAMAVVEQATGEAGTVRWTIRVRTRDLTLGAYQGEVTYPATAYEVVSVATPEEGGATRVVNAGEPGRIRFAAFALEAFRSDVVLTATLRERQPNAASEVRATLDVAGTPEGEAVASTQLVPSAGIQR